MNEIAERLRNWRLVHLTQLRYLMETASDEIERLQALADNRGELAVERRREILQLRERLSRTGTNLRQTCDEAAECGLRGAKCPERDHLTHAEREAIRWVCGDVADITGPVEDTLRGLLARLGV
jgi:hypothetical protein